MRGPRRPRSLGRDDRVIHDLGCGIGADAMALAGLDVGVHAVDSDDVTAVVAGVNLRHWPHADVVHGSPGGRHPAGR